MKQEITITVDIPEGYEATGEYRRAEDSDVWLGSEASVMRGGNMNSRIILRKKWTAPEFLRPGWIAQMFDGRWFWSDTEPEGVGNGYVVRGQHFLLSNVDWTPPDVASPVQSLTRIGGEE